MIDTLPQVLPIDNTLPDHSRIWVYQSQRNLNEEEKKQILASANEFTASWAAHGAALTAAIEIYFDRFLIVFVDEEAVKASGCSIDSSVHWAQEIDQQYQLDLFNRMRLTYWHDEQWWEGTPDQLTPLKAAGIISSETPVFNALVTNKAALNQQWCIPIEKSWAWGRV